MSSIANHYSVKAPVPSVGTKRKSTVAFGEEGVPKKSQGNKRIVRSDSNKDSVIPPPPSKRQKVDGATLAAMEQKASTVTPTATNPRTKEQDDIAKKTMRTQQRRRSSKGRLSTGGPAARAKAVEAGKVAYTSKLLPANCIP
jgi:hypothetical protein